MAKRTRRNLSDPTIKRIVKAQTEKSTRFNAKKPHGKNDRHSFKRLLTTLTLLTVVISGIYLLYSQRSELQFMFSQAWNAIETTAPAPPSASNEMPAAAEQNHPAEQESDFGVEETTREPVKTSQEAPTENSPLKPVARRIQVEILNGCGVNGLAEKLTRYLRQENIDVVSTGNYLHFQVSQTQILDRTGQTERIRLVADIIGLPANHIKSQKDADLQLDATIILGADYKQLKPFLKQGGS